MSEKTFFCDLSLKISNKKISELTFIKKNKGGAEHVVLSNKTYKTFKEDTFKTNELKLKTISSDNSFIEIRSSEIYKQEKIILKSRQLSYKINEIIDSFIDNSFIQENLEEICKCYSIIIKEIKPKENKIILFEKFLRKINSNNLKKMESVYKMNF